MCIYTIYIRAGHLGSLASWYKILPRPFGEAKVSCFMVQSTTHQIIHEHIIMCTYMYTEHHSQGESLV